jgi:hypothetical protein
LTANPDGRTRSAADVAIVSLMKANLTEARFPAAVVAFIDSMRTDSTATSATPASPADIGAMSRPVAAQSKVAERMARLVPEWASSAPENLWGSVVEPVIQKLFAFPDDTTVVQAFRVLAPFLCKPNASMLISLIAARMRVQPNLPEEKDVETDRLKALLFERLSPLLALKMIPIAAVEPAITATSILPELLLERLSQPLEFEDVRKLAAECMASLPPALVVPRLLNALTELLQNIESQVQIRALCYAIGGALARSPQSVLPLVNDFRLTDRLLELTTRPTAPALKTMAIEVLAQIAKCERSETLLTAFMESATRTPPDRTCSSCTGVLISLARLLDNEDELLGRLLSAVLALARVTFASDKSPAAQRANLLHLLFVLVHRLKSKVSGHSLELHGIAIASLRASQDDQCRLNSLKLLGAVVTHSAQQLFSPDSPMLLLETRDAIQAVAKTDQNVQVRDLASKLADLIFPPT